MHAVPDRLLFCRTVLTGLWLSPPETKISIIFLIYPSLPRYPPCPKNTAVGSTGAASRENSARKRHRVTDGGCWSSETRRLSQWRRNSRVYSRNDDMSGEGQGEARGIEKYTWRRAEEARRSEANYSPSYLRNQGVEASTGGAPEPLAAV